MVRNGGLPVGGAARSLDAVESAVAAPAVFCPFPARISPYVAEVSRYTMWWATRHRFLPDAAAGARFARSRFASLTARAYPEAGRAALCLAASWLTFIVMLDDHLETVLGRDPERQRTAAAATLSYLRVPGTEPPRPLAELLGRPLAGALTDVWSATVDRTGPDWRQRFTGHVARYLDANAWEADNRRADRVPTVERFLEMRWHTSAVALFFDLIELVNGAELPAGTHAGLAEVYRHAGNAVACFNDLVSWRKELHAGDPHNLVLVVRHDRRTTLAGAVREAVAWHDAEVRAYVLGRAAVRERYGDGSDVVRAVDGLSYWIRGPIDWSCESGRYAEAST